MKIIIFPQFRFPTGHLKVAEVVKETINQNNPDLEIKIIDFLSYCNKYLEKVVAFLYLKWIELFPDSYKKFYHYGMNSGANSKFRINHSITSRYFEKKMMKLTSHEKPTIIFCTHSFPSRILGKLKQKGYLADVTIVNVYTDFFINGVWATSEVDYHLVPHQKAKNDLLANSMVDKANIFVTGIPVDQHFMKDYPTTHAKKYTKHIIVAGGNHGFFQASKLFCEKRKEVQTSYTVLCGKNNKLFETLCKLNVDWITPKKYISSWKELSHLYQTADAILTKPGGVTISEALHMKLPIFIHSPLPGQEDINLEYLFREGLAFQVPAENMTDFITTVLADEIEMNRYVKKADHYLQTLTAYPKVLENIIAKKRSKVYMNSNI